MQAIRSLSMWRKASMTLAAACVAHVQGVPGAEAVGSGARIVDVQGKNAAEISAIRGSLSERTPILFEIKSGINSDLPDFLVTKRPLDARGLQFGNTLRDLLDAAGSTTKQVVSTSDMQNVLSQRALTPKVPTSARCQRALESGATGRDDSDLESIKERTSLALIERNCMATLDTLPSWATNQPIAQAVGSLYVSTDGGVTMDTFCTGLLISANEVVTAKHCFYMQEGAGGTTQYFTKLTRGNVYFATARLPAVNPIKVRRILKPAQVSGGFPRLDDLLLLELSEKIGGPIPKYVFRDPTPGEELLIAGNAPNMHDRSASLAAASVLRYSSEVDCQAFAVAAGCVRHDCQTQLRFSGAPVFAPLNMLEQQEHVVRIAAFHLGITIDNECAAAAEATPGHELIGNEGIVASRAQVLMSSWQDATAIAKGDEK